MSISNKVDVPWVEAIRTKPNPELLVFFGDSVAKGIFAKALPLAISGFNALFKDLGFKVRLKSTTDVNDKPTPDANNYRGADIWVETGETFTFVVSGRTETITMEPFVRGFTQRLPWDFGKGAELRKAVILMKGNIKSDDAPRTVGDPALKVQAIHEFIHAIGLGAHTAGGGDFYEEMPTLLSPEKANADKDVLRLVGGARVPRQKPDTELFLLESTKKRIVALWPP
jgi:hypothetical protein